MSDFLTFLIVGVSTGCIYALAASGLVVTYTTSGIFNFAHGGLSMLLAFAYWQVAIKWGVPAPLALILVLGVLAPLLGAFIERALMRRLHGSSTGTSLVVTLGLLVTTIGIGNVLWDQSQPRQIPEFFAGHAVRLLGLNVSWHRIIALLAAIAVAVGLRLLFYRTRSGIAMRAVVDDPELTSLNGASPARVAQMSWALGTMLAGLAGILLAPLVSLEVLTLTLLILNAFAATVVGRLKSLPLTFAGSIALGVLTSLAVGYLNSMPGGKALTRIQPALPTIFLFVALLVVPQARLRVGRVLAQRAPRVPGLRESVIGGVALVAAVWFVTGILGAGDVIRLGSGLALGLIMLSLVLLTGYGGQVSLCQLTFVGLGAFTFGKVAASGSLLGVIPAILAAAAVGAVVSLFAIRVQALYLALATLAFAQAMDLVFFQDSRVFGYGGRLPVARLHLPGISLDSNRAYAIVVAVVFAAAAVGVLSLRRGAFGRRLSAMSDSPAACATLGLNLTVTRLVVFTVSAGLAGLAGVFFGGVKTSVGPSDFELLQSLILLLLATIGGINTVSGALLGGLVFAMYPWLQEHVALLHSSSLQYIATGLGAISLGRNPNGIAGSLSEQWERLRDRLPGRVPVLNRPDHEGVDLARAAS